MSTRSKARGEGRPSSNPPLQLSPEDDNQIGTAANRPAVTDGSSQAPMTEQPSMVASTDTKSTTTKKRRRRTREERGLADPKLVRTLARAYLILQAKLWPKLAKDGTIPKPTKATVRKMASDFRVRFLDPGADPSNAVVPMGATIAAAYLRYSSEKSNPRSLIQQLKRCLIKAHSNKHFIPLDAVFADAGVTGTTAGHRGYEMAKRLWLTLLHRSKCCTSTKSAARAATQLRL